MLLEQKILEDQIHLKKQLRSEKPGGTTQYQEGKFCLHTSSSSDFTKYDVSNANEVFKLRKSSNLNFIYGNLPASNCLWINDLYMWS